MMDEPELNRRDMKELFSAIVDLRNPTEAKKFLRDIATLAELKAMAERWEVAKLVKRGLPYRTIARQTGASTATITRVAQWLHHGMGGYKLMLHRLGR